MPGGNRCVRGEDRGPADLGERVIERRTLLAEIADPLKRDEGGMSFVEVVDRRLHAQRLERTHTTHAEDDLLLHARVCDRLRIDAPRDRRSPVALSSRFVSSRNSVTRPTRTRQTAANTVRSPSGTAVTQGAPSGVRARSIGVSVHSSVS